MSTTLQPQFAAGDAVRVQDRPVIGHCRAPWFLRGRPGIIEMVVGSFRNPEQLAYHKPGLPEKYLYRVRFDQGDLWEAYQGRPGDAVLADIFENWLEMRE
jgi:nitrile hydratase